MVDKGREFTKHFGFFTERVGGWEVATVKDLPTQIITNSHISCNIVYSKVLVESWAFVEDEDTLNPPCEQIIKLLKSDGEITYYSTVSIGRVDVANKFGNKKIYAHQIFCADTNRITGYCRKHFQYYL